MKKIILPFFMMMILSLTVFAGWDDEVAVVNENDSTFSILDGDMFVVDFLKAATAESGSKDDVKLNYTFTLDADVVKAKYDEIQGEYNHLDEGDNGKVKFNVSLTVYTAGEYNYQVFVSSTYAYSEVDLSGNANADYLNFVYEMDDNPFVTVSKNGSVLTVSINATVKEIADYIATAEDYDGGDITGITFGFNVSGTKHKIPYSGATYENEKMWEPFKGVNVSIDDAHTREAEMGFGLNGEYREHLQEVSLSTPITIVDHAPYLDYEAGTFDERYYTPTSVSYTWLYEIYHGDSIQGEYTTTNPTFRLEDLITEENKDFIEGLVGAGWDSSINLRASVTFTYADGVVSIFEEMYGPFEMLMVAPPCIHSCTVCGLCTVTDYITSCNMNMDTWFERKCICETPNAIEIEIEAIAEEDIVVGEDSVTETPVTVKIDKVGFDSAMNTPIIKKLAKSIDLDKTALVLDIRIYNEYEEPYKLNQYTEGESLTITVNVGTENAAAVAAGTLVLYHVADDGTAEVIDATADAANGTITFTSGSFSFYALGEPVEEEPEEPAEPAAEDINGDGSVTVADVLLVLHALLNGSTLENGDLNRDGSLTLIDVIRVLKAAVA